jgi:hypothetical protein
MRLSFDYMRVHACSPRRKTPPQLSTAVGWEDSRTTWKQAGPTSHQRADRRSGSGPRYRSKCFPLSHPCNDPQTPDGSDKKERAHVHRSVESRVGLVSRFRIAFEGMRFDVQENGSLPALLWRCQTLIRKHPPLPSTCLPNRPPVCLMFVYWGGFDRR